MAAGTRCSAACFLALLVSVAACTPLPVSPAGMLAYEVSLAADGGSLAVAWYATDQARNVIWLQPLDERDRARGAPRRLTDGANDAFEPDLQFIEGDAVVAWYEKSSDGTLRAWLGRFDREGEPRWRRPLSPPGRQSRNPVVRIGPDGLHVAWLESDGGAPGKVEVRTALYDASGDREGTALLVGGASEDTWNLNADLSSDDSFLIAWDARTASKAREVMLASVSPAGTHVAQISADDGLETSYPDIAVNGDRAALAWSDTRDGNAEIYLAVGSPADLATDLGARARRVTRTNGSSVGAYAAWNGERLMLAWCDDSTGRQEVYRQTFSAQGEPLTRIEQVTRTRADSMIPSVRPIGDGFALAWTERESRPEPDAAGNNPTLSSRVRVLRAH